LSLNRLNIVLGILLLACALALVTAQARARKLFVDHERARASAKQLEVRWNELQVQQTQFAKASLIDARARRDMGMQSVSSDRLVHLDKNSSSVTTQSGSPASEGVGRRMLSTLPSGPTAQLPPAMEAR
jgi:cell division protein FtsL